MVKRMSERAIISIISNSSIEDEENIEIISLGEYEKSEYGCKVNYEETELSGMKGTKTTVTIEKDKVILEREGTITTKMEFDVITPGVSLYNTPYGLLELTILTNELNVEFNEKLVVVDIDYDMGVAGQEAVKIGRASCRERV